jgi:hypothetical protein
MTVHSRWVVWPPFNTAACVKILLWGKIAYKFTSCKMRNPCTVTEEVWKEEVKTAILRHYLLTESPLYFV